MSSQMENKTYIPESPCSSILGEQGKVLPSLITEEVTSSPLLVETKVPSSVACGMVVKKLSNFNPNICPAFQASEKSSKSSPSPFIETKVSLSSTEGEMMKKMSGQSSRGETAALDLAPTFGPKRKNIIIFDEEETIKPKKFKPDDSSDDSDDSDDNDDNDGEENREKIIVDKIIMLKNARLDGIITSKEYLERRNKICPEIGLFMENENQKKEDYPKILNLLIEEMTDRRKKIMTKEEIHNETYGYADHTCGKIKGRWKSKASQDPRLNCKHSDCKLWQEKKKDNYKQNSKRSKKVKN